MSSTKGSHSSYKLPMLRWLQINVTKEIDISYYDRQLFWETDSIFVNSFTQSLGSLLVKLWQNLRHLSDLHVYIHHE